MNQSDKTRDKLVSSIRRTKAEESGETARAASPSKEGGAAPARPGPSSRAKPRPARKKAAARKSESSRAGGDYALGGLRWPD